MRVGLRLRVRVRLRVRLRLRLRFRVKVALYRCYGWFVVKRSKGKKKEV